ncbi:MAG: HAMP domain-containing sensor histidine kinase [Desulfosoma sp.]
MDRQWGILKKIFGWYGLLGCVFFMTLGTLYYKTHQLMAISEEMVGTSYRLSTLAKSMLEQLLAMEENEKKFLVLRNPQYKEYFASSLKEFEVRLSEALALLGGTGDALPLENVAHEFHSSRPAVLMAMDGEPTGTLWIPEETLNRWIQKVSLFKEMEERRTQIANRSLHQHGRTALRWGFIGIAVSLAACLLGAFSLARSIRRPLRELQRGIRALTRKGSAEPVKILSKDEFGELAFAFNEMLHRLDEEERLRTDFLSMLTHEIRNPLTTVRESIRLVEEETMGPVHASQKRFLNLALRELDRIGDLLGQLLQTSRLESQTLHMDPQVIGPGDLVDAAVHRAAPLGQAKGVIVHSSVADDLPNIIGDMDHLQRVLMNLVANAVKFSPSGATVHVRAEKDAEGRVVFSVRDQGPGIPKAEQPLVFRKYYRVSSFQDHFDGTGLGLHIAKHIVEAHGGKIWVESEPGQGSTFFFHLPVKG